MSSQNTQLLAQIIADGTKEYIQIPSHMFNNISIQSAADSDTLRKTYLEMIACIDWKKQFVDAVTLIKNKLVNDFENSYVDNDKFTMGYKEKLYEFNATNNPIILIGRMPECDINILNQTTSRVHLIVIPLPQYKKYLVVDMGSFDGFETLKRESSNPLIKSTNGHRNIMVCDWDEIAIIKLGFEIIAINPKECVVCYEAPRTSTLGCGHHVTCDNCTKIIKSCPICRIPLRESLFSMGYDLHTKVIV